MTSSSARLYGGKTGELLLAYDWTNSPLGPKEDWPQNLSSALSFVLSSRCPTVLFWGPHLICIYNDASIPIFGLRHPHSFGKPARESWGEVWTFVEPLIEEVFTGKPTSTESQHIPIRRNGYLEESYFSWSVTPVWGSDGRIMGAVSSVVETTAHVLSERRFRLLCEFNKWHCTTEAEAGSCIASVLSQGSHDFPFSATYFLASTKKFVLLAKTGFPGDHVAVPPHLIEGKEGPWPINEALATGSIVIVNDLVAKFGALPGGQWEESPTSAVVVPLCAYTGTERDVIGVFIAGLNTRRQFDIVYKGFVELVTAHISSVLSFARVNAEQRKRVDILAGIEKAKTFFFSNVSHEFRTPLSLILGQVEESLGDTESPLPPTQRARQNVVHRNSLRLLKLINSLLDLAKIDAGRMKRSFIPVDLALTTRDLANTFRSAIENAGLTLTINCTSLGEMVYVDTEMWEKIICNLMSNALKYTFKGEVKVVVRKKPEYAEVLVSDTGVGIPEYALAHLFERFHRITGVVGRSYEGAGLGLALSLELVKLHNGNIHVDSTVGEGSTITVTIPLGAEHLPQANPLVSPTKVPTIGIGPTFVEEASRWVQKLRVEDTAANPAHPVSISPVSPPLPKYRVSTLAHSPSLHTNTGDNRPSIVFASGNQDMGQYISSLLSPLYRLGIVTNGKKAVELAAIDPPDLILCDTVLPEASGLEVLKAIKEKFQLQRIPFIFITSSEKLEGMTDISADDYLVPPFSAQELLTRVNSYIELGRLRRNTQKFSLDKTEEYYRSLVHGLPVGIFELNASRDIIFHNRKWAEITGYFEGRPPDAMVGKDWIECVHPDDRAMVAEALNTAQNTMINANLEARILKRDGCVMWVFIDYRPFLAPDGTFQGACATIIDVTERVGPLRDVLVEEQRRANEAEEHKRKYELFVDMVCHEIRNPINGIQNNVDLLMNGVRMRTEYIRTLPVDFNATIPTEQLAMDKEALDSIIMCANQQRVVADDVLHLSALESGKVVLNDVSFDPRKIVERVVKTYRAEAAAKHIQFIVNVPKEEAFVRGDPDRLLQVMFNLVTNAIKFTEKSEVKKITVTLELLPGTPPAQDKTTLGVTIEDTGLGMTPNEQAALFKRFSQANVQTYREYGGSGLGLFITKGLIDLMGGDIKVSSAKFKGTKFYFTAQCKVASFRDEDIPAHLDSPSPELPARRALSPGASLQILIAEDDVINQKVLKRHLEQGNHVVTIASNGQAALDFMQKQRFDLIFMDLEMPVMGGLEATRAIRREEEKLSRPKIPIIGLSGNARKEYLRTALGAGMDSYIVKPYQKEDLFAKIHELVKLNIDG